MGSGWGLKRKCMNPVSEEWLPDKDIWHCWVPGSHMGQINRVLSAFPALSPLHVVLTPCLPKGDLSEHMLSLLSLPETFNKPVRHVSTTLLEKCPELLKPLHICSNSDSCLIFQHWFHLGPGYLFHQQCYLDIPNAQALCMELSYN